MINRYRYIGQSRFLIVLLTTLTVFLRPANAEMPTKEKRRDYSLVFYENGALIVILPPDERLATEEWGVDAAWGPQASQVRAAERKIVSVLSMESPLFSKNRAQYVRQYFGLIDNGRKRLMCILFHEDLFSFFDGTSAASRMKELLSRPFSITDQGGKYIVAEYDLERRTIKIVE